MNLFKLFDVNICLKFMFSRSKNYKFFTRSILQQHVVQWSPRSGKIKKGSWYWFSFCLKLTVQQNARVQLFDPGLNRELSTSRELCCSKSIDFVFCIRILIVSNFQAVHLLITCPSSQSANSPYLQSSFVSSKFQSKVFYLWRIFD